VGQPAGQPGGGAGAVPAAEVAKRPGLRGYLDSARAAPGKVGQFLVNEAGNVSRAAASEAGGAILGAATQAYNELPGIRKVFSNDQSTDIDKGTQLYEGIARSANVGAGAALGTKAGVMAGTALAPFTGGLSVPVLGALGGVGGGLYGNYATNKAIEAGRALVGADTTSPADRIPTQPTRTPFDQLPQASYSNEGRNYRNGGLREQFVGQNAQGAQLATDLRNPMSNATLQKVNPDGQVTKDGNTYSGTNVSGLVSLTDTNGKALPGQAKGGWVSGTGDGSFRFASPAEVAALRNPDGSKWSANDNAIMAANLRDGV